MLQKIEVVNVSETQRNELETKTKIWLMEVKQKANKENAKKIDKLVNSLNYKRLVFSKTQMGNFIAIPYNDGFNINFGNKFFDDKVSKDYLVLNANQNNIISKASLRKVISSVNIETDDLFDAFLNKHCKRNIDLYTGNIFGTIKKGETFINSALSFKGSLRKKTNDNLREDFGCYYLVWDITNDNTGEIVSTTILGYFCPLGPDDTDDVYGGDGSGGGGDALTNFNEYEIVPLPQNSVPSLIPNYFSLTPSVGVIPILKKWDIGNWTIKATGEISAKVSIDVTVNVEQNPFLLWEIKNNTMPSNVTHQTIIPDVPNMQSRSTLYYSNHTYNWDRTIAITKISVAYTVLNLASGFQSTSENWDYEKTFTLDRNLGTVK